MPETPAGISFDEPILDAAPAAVSDNDWRYTTTEDVPLTLLVGDIPGNDTDADGDALALVDWPLTTAHGTLERV